MCTYISYLFFSCSFYGILCSVYKNSINPARNDFSAPFFESMSVLTVTTSTGNIFQLMGLLFSQEGAVKGRSLQYSVIQNLQSVYIWLWYNTQYHYTMVKWKKEVLLTKLSTRSHILFSRTLTCIRYNRLSLNHITFVAHYHINGQINMDRFTLVIWEC